MSGFHRDPMPSDPPFQPMDDSDPDRAREFFALLKRKLVFYFRHRNFRDPEDLAQDVLTRAWQQYRRGTPITTELLNYCYGIANVMVFEQQRKRARQELLLEDRLPTGAAEAESMEIRILADQIVKNLPDCDRQMVVAYYRDDRTELAAKLGITEANLRLRVFRIIRRLRAVLGSSSIRTRRE